MRGAKESEHLNGNAGTAKPTAGINNCKNNKCNGTRKWSKESNAEPATEEPK